MDKQLAAILGPGHKEMLMGVMSPHVPHKLTFYIDIAAVTCSGNPGTTTAVCSTLHRIVFYFRFNTIWPCWSWHVVIRR